MAEGAESPSQALQSAADIAVAAGAVDVEGAAAGDAADTPYSGQGGGEA